MIPNCCSCVRCQAIKMHLHLTEVVTGWPTQKIMKYFKLWEDEQVSSLLKPTLEKNQERTGIANAGWFIHKYAQMLKVVPHTAHLMTLFRSTSIKMQREILCLIIFFFWLRKLQKKTWSKQQRQMSVILPWLISFWIANKHITCWVYPCALSRS